MAQNLYFSQGSMTDKNIIGVLCVALDVCDSSKYTSELAETHSS